MVSNSSRRAVARSVSGSTSTANLRGRVAIEKVKWARASKSGGRSNVACQRAHARGSGRRGSERRPLRRWQWPTAYQQPPR